MSRVQKHWPGRPDWLTTLSSAMVGFLFSEKKLRPCLGLAAFEKNHLDKPVLFGISFGVTDPSKQLIQLSTRILNESFRSMLYAVSYVPLVSQSQVALICNTIFTLSLHKLWTEKESFEQTRKKIIP